MLCFRTLQNKKKQHFWLSCIHVSWHSVCLEDEHKDAAPVATNSLKGHLYLCSLCIVHWLYGTVHKNHYLASAVAPLACLAVVGL